MVKVDMPRCYIMPESLSESGEDLEIYVNAKNFSGSLYFRGVWVGSIAT